MGRSRMMQAPIVLIGWGRVAQEFWDVVEEQAPALRDRYAAALSPRGATLAMVKDVLGLCAGERSPGLG